MSSQEITTDVWLIAAIIYCILAFVTFIPVLSAILTKVKLNPDGSAYDESPNLSEEQKKRLNQHYSRIQGTLIFWKNLAEKHKRFHIYTLIWTTLISITLPLLIQAIGENNFSKLLMTIISIHSALLTGFYRAFKVDKNYQCYRIAESEFYDMRREFLDNTHKNLENMDSEIDLFIGNVSKLRINARKMEIDNTPSLKQEN